MDQDFYEILGVSRDADSITIRHAFKKLALTHHPDKVAEADRPEAEVRFKMISEAYEVLSNEESRILYDAQADLGGQFGGGGTASDWQDFYYSESGGMPEFADFAAGGGPQDYASAYGESYGWSSKRTPDAQFDVDLNLEDVYFGRMIKLRTVRQVLCRRCHGSGGKPGAKKHRCQTCKGFGTTKKTHLVGPGLLATSTVLCEVCHGFGEIYRNKDLCRRCRGKRTQELKTMIEVYVPKGVKNRHRIVVEGQADEEPGKATGDLVITVHVDAQHPVFRREGADLYAAATISLRESLTGFSRPLITHLDGRVLKPTVPRGQIVQPQSVLKIPGEGLVIEEAASGGQADFTGDLYLQIAVEFPTNIEPHILDKVARLLIPTSAADELDGEVSDDTLSNANDDAEKDAVPEYTFSEDASKGSVTDVDYQIMHESDLPEYQADANDEPEAEPAPGEDSRTSPGANSGSGWRPQHTSPLSGCAAM